MGYCPISGFCRDRGAPSHDRAFSVAIETTQSGCDTGPWCCDRRWVGFGSRPEFLGRDRGVSKGKGKGCRDKVSDRVWAGTGALESRQEFCCRDRALGQLDGFGSRLGFWVSTEAGAAACALQSEHGPLKRLVALAIRHSARALCT